MQISIDQLRMIDRIRSAWIRIRIQIRDARIRTSLIGIDQHWTLSRDSWEYQSIGGQIDKRSQIIIFCIPNVHA